MLHLVEHSLDSGGGLCDKVIGRSHGQVCIEKPLESATGCYLHGVFEMSVFIRLRFQTVVRQDGQTSLGFVVF